MKKFLIVGMLAGAALAASPAWAQADDYPSRTVRFVVPLGPGSGADNYTRVLADSFSKLTGTTAIVENRPGADLSVGTAAVTNAPPDGHSVLLISASTVVINPLMMKEMPYKVEDVRPILHLTNNVAVLVTAANSSFNSLEDVLNAARKAPQSVSIGVYGNTYRLGKDVLAKAANVQFNDIPYSGFGATVTDVIGGTTQTALVDLGGALPLIQSGKLKALAVASKERMPMVPDVPTVSESGVPGYSFNVFIGYAVHADTPEPIFTKLESLLQKASHDQAMQDTLKNQAGTFFVGDLGKPFAEFIDGEAAKAKEVIAPAS